MSEEEIYKMLLNENIEKFPLLNEIFAIRNNKFKINDYTIYVTGCISLDVINRAIEKANLIDKLQKENENAKWYIHQMIARINEDIADFIDDDKERNKNRIGELKETREQWRDVEKLLNGESKDNLYNDWRKYGEYE